MEKNFKETNIPNDLSSSLAQQGLLMGPTHASKVVTSLFSGISKCLANVKDISVPKAVVFKTIDGKFIVAAIVKYVKNGDNEEGSWNYIWSFDEKDVDDTFQIIDFSNALVLPYIKDSANTLYGMSFADNAVCASMMTLVLEMILGWLKENTKDGEDSTLTLPGVFTATGKVEDGNLVLSMIPDGDMKVIIKDDSNAES